MKTASAPLNWTLAVALLLALMLSSCRGPEQTLFEIGFPTLDDGRFVIALSDPAKIAAARKAIEDPEHNPFHVMGRIVKTPATYNAPWGYHLDPATISFFEAAVEVCDAAPQYVEDHLDEVCGATLPGCEWCPWSSQVLAELD